MTGQELFSYFRQKVGYAYTGNLSSSVQANNLFKDALYKAVEKVYRTNPIQSKFDRINALISTNNIVTPFLNKISVLGSAPLVADYLHLLYIQAKFVLPTTMPVVNMSNTSPIVMEGWYSSLRNGQQVLITGSTGNTTANGTFFLKQVNPKKFKLYYNAELTAPTTGNGEYEEGATISLLYYKTCKQLISEQKGAILQEATVEYPKYELANSDITLYPLDKVCVQVTMDYITKAAVLIDVADGVIDLEETYPYQFLVENVFDEAAQLFSERYRDAELRNVTLQDAQKNN